MALIKDGDPVFVLERRHIEGRSASAIAGDLKNAFETYCGPDGKAASGEVETPEAPEAQAPEGVPSTFRSIL